MNKMRHVALRTLLLSVLILLASLASSAEYALEWNPDQDPRVSNYRIYYGEAPHAYDQWFDVGDVTSYRITDLDPQTIYYFAVKVTDGGSRESDFSNEVTSGRFRYVFGWGAYPASGGLLDIANSNHTWEQEIPVGWSEYNALSGEARVAAGDIDGDGRDELVIGFAPVKSGMPGGRFQVLDDDFSHMAWGQLTWPDYNATTGETRPALGDIDGDGRAEIFIGLGQEGNGAIEMFRFADGTLSSIGWTQLNWSSATWPAAGDIDGDGLAELVIGLDSGGYFIVKKGLDANLLSAGADPWLEELQGDISWSEYASQVGETRPALGDLNGNGREEIAVGLGEAGAGNLEIFAYQPPSLLSLATAVVAWPDYNNANGETRPTIGDVDDDGRSEIIVGLGSSGGAYVELIEDAGAHFINASELMGPYATQDYQDANGALWTAYKLERAEKE